MFKETDNHHIKRVPENITIRKKHGFSIQATLEYTIVNQDMGY